MRENQFLLPQHGYSFRMVADGTVYRGTVVFGPDGALLSLALPDFKYACGDFGSFGPEPEWLAHDSDGKLSMIDGTNVAGVVDLCRKRWAEAHK